MAKQKTYSTLACVCAYTIIVAILGYMCLPILATINLYQFFFLSAIEYVFFYTTLRLWFTRTYMRMRMRNKKKNNDEEDNPDN